jgi:hypothetical protein
LKKVAPIIDAELCNEVLRIQALCDAIEPGFSAKEWLAERGL